MKICITSRGKTLDSPVDPRFGRCAYFIIADPATLNFEVIENSAVGAGGAGIQSGQLVAEKGVAAVVTGNVGPNAFQVLQAAGIDIITGAGGIVRDALVKYKNGKFKPTAQPTVETHAGMNSTG